MLRAEVGEANQLVPPVNGWEFWVDNDKWISDPTLEVSSELSEPCREVIIELGGAAKEERPECEGSYLPVKGTVVRGRQVVLKAQLIINILYFQLLQNASSKQYLQFGGSRWEILSIINEERIVFSASAGSLCPAHPSNAVNSRQQVTGWRYKRRNNRKWQNGEINVKCLTHSF